MNNFEKASHIRRVVDNEAYNMIEDETYPEFWDLHYRVTMALQDEGIDCEEGSLTDAMVKTQCRIFLNDRVESKIDEVEHDQYSAIREMHEKEQYQQAHMPGKI